MHHRIRLYERADNKRGRSMVKGAIYVEGTLAEAVESAHVATGKLSEVQLASLVRIEIDQADPPAGSDPFGNVGGTDAKDGAGNTPAQKAK